jgi:hypothetical protein
MARLLHRTIQSVHRSTGTNDTHSLSRLPTNPLDYGVPINITEEAPASLSSSICSSKSCGGRIHRYKSEQQALLFCASRLGTTHRWRMDMAGRRPQLRRSSNCGFVTGIVVSNPSTSLGLIQAKAVAGSELLERSKHCGQNITYVPQGRDSRPAYGEHDCGVGTRCWRLDR